MKRPALIKRSTLAVAALIVAGAVALTGVTATAATPAPPDPTPDGPQRPYEPDVSGPENVDTLAVTATKGPGAA